MKISDKKSILGLVALALLVGFIVGQTLASDGWVGLTSYLAITFLLVQATSWVRKRRAKKKQRQKEMEESLEKFAGAFKAFGQALLSFQPKTKPSNSQEETASTPAPPVMPTGMLAIAQGLAQQPASSGEEVAVVPPRMLTVYRRGEAYSYLPDNRHWHEDMFDNNVVWGPCADFDCKNSAPHSVTYTKTKPVFPSIRTFDTPIRVSTPGYGLGRNSRPRI